MITKHFFATLLTACLTILTGAMANGAVIITPSGASSSLPSLGGRPIGETINGTGLSSGGTSGDILTETHNPNSANSGEYFISNGNNPTLTFTLPAASTVDTIHLWTYTRAGEQDRAMQSFTIAFSSDGTNYGTGIPLSGWTQVPVAQIVVQSQTFTEQTAVTHVRIDTITNHGDPNYVGLSEIRFGSSIPEPSGNLLLGLAGLALARRRRA